MCQMLWKADIQKYNGIAGPNPASKTPKNTRATTTPAKLKPVDLGNDQSTEIKFLSSYHQGGSNSPADSRTSHPNTWGEQLRSYGGGNLA